MSVPLTLIRLEVAGDCLLPDISYKVKKEENQEARDLVSKVDVSELSRDPQLLLGKRKFSKITVETYMASNIEDENPISSKKYKTFAEAAKSQQCTEVTTRSEHNDKGQPRASSLFEEVKSKKKPGTHEATISGALKQPMHKSQSPDISPRPGHTPPDAGHDGRVYFKPVNLDMEEARSRPMGHPHSPPPDSLTFFCGNPSVETTEGVIHLYKEEGLTPLRDPEARRGELLCMLNVPTNITSQDLIQMLGPVEHTIEHIKIIRDGTPNHYMILVKFKCQAQADEFYHEFNGKPFNSIEPEVCCLVYVAKIEAIKSANGAGFPIPGVTELPTCPVCLERMDESVNGILTILCNHSFHTACLAHWDDTSCPVCRYTQTPESVADNKCFECSAVESLWICLICGYVGCGRYVQGHAFTHFQETNHTYSMQLGNNRVWDYAGDNYVHRLVQSKSDGKMVQVGEAGSTPEGEEKLDAITLEYTYLLNTQLESQRHYFEGKLSLVEQEAMTQLSESECRARDLADKCATAEGQLNSLTSEKKALDKKYAEVAARYSKTLRLLSDEQEMNKYLRENQSGWQAKVSELETRLSQKDEEVADLQDQLRDVMLHIGAQEKLSASNDVSREELEAGQLVVGSATARGSNSAAAKNARKKKR